MNLPTLESLGDLSGKRVLLRTSLNVPLDEGDVRNDFRLQKALPTIDYLRNAGAKVLILAHLGRDGDSLLPIFEALTKTHPMLFAPDFESDQTKVIVGGMKNGDVLLFENVRRDPREEANDPAFAAMLAHFGDAYVNDAFADSHRAHASIVGIPALLPSAAGILMTEEVQHLSRALSPVHPSLFILGGAKFETKRPLLEKCLPLYDHVFTGGAIANDFFKAMGYETGTSLVSPNIAGAFDTLRAHGNLLLPLDVTVTKDGVSRIATPETVARDEMIVDAGPATLEALTHHINEGKFILWNGPLGNYELGFNTNTEAVAHAIAGSSATSIVGGGDTVAAIAKLGLSEKFTFLSTGGGAMLDFLATGTSPAIDALLAPKTPAA